MKWHSTQRARGNYVPFKFSPPTYAHDAAVAAKNQAADDSRAKMRVEARPSAALRVSQKSKSDWWVWALVILVALLVGYFTYNHFGPNSQF